MKFLIDAQLPSRLKLWLIASGFDAIDTGDLSNNPCFLIEVTGKNVAWTPALSQLNSCKRAI